MNPLYQQLVGGQMSYQAQTPMQAPAFNNPMQKMQYVMQAMSNPAQFVMQAFPDIPPQMQNNPNQILQYLQQTRGISNQQIQNIMNQIPR